MPPIRLMIALALALAGLAARPAAAQSSPSPYTLGTRYDLMHRVVGTIAPDPDGGGAIRYAAVRNTYDPDGRLVTVESGELANWKPESIAPADWGADFTVFRTVTTGYDSLDRKTSVAVSAGAAIEQLTQYSYDPVGRPLCTAVRMNKAIFATIAVDACTLGTPGTGANAFGPDRITRDSYDPLGQVTGIKKAYGVTVTNGFAATLEQDYVRYSYSPNGKQTSVIDANGNRAGYAYDGFDRQIGWSFPSKAGDGTSASCTLSPVSETGGITSPPETRGASDDCEKYAYDANGNRATLMKRDGSVIRYSYDALDRVTVKDIPGGASADVYYSYDFRGLQTQARFGSATGTSRVSSGYDGYGELTSSTTVMGGWSRELDYQFDGDGNRTRVTWPDGNWFAYGYDGLDRESSIKENGSATIATFTYDARGERTRQSHGANSTSYTYDDISRLASAVDSYTGTAQDLTTGLTYSPASQIVTRTRDNDAYAFTGYDSASTAYTPNGLNQFASVGGTTFAYDLNGNLTGDGSNAYTYDVENRLISATAGGVTTNIKYDALGRLWQTAKPGATTQFLYDGDALSGEYDNTNNLLRRYVHGSEEDDPLLWYEGSDLATRRSLTDDWQGSIIGVADASGTSLARNSYDEYGNTATTYASLQRFLFTGQAWLPEVGLYYYKARMYAPALGRFLQTDPVGYADQNNLYAYVANDPMDGADASGECTGSLISDKDGGCVGGGFVSGVGSCVGNCTSNRDRANMAVDSAISQAKSDAKSPNDNSCLTSPECGGKTPPSLARTLLPLFRSSKFRSSVISAWASSRPKGNASFKNEHAFWANSSGNRISVGPIFTGQGDHVSYYDAIFHWNGENVFTHTHPFLTSEGYEYGFSSGDQRFLDEFRIVGIVIETDGVYYYDGRH